MTPDSKGSSSLLAVVRLGRGAPVVSDLVTVTSVEKAAVCDSRI